MKICKFIRSALIAFIATYGLGSTALYAQSFELEGNILAEGDVDWSSLFTVSGTNVPEEKATLPNNYGPVTFVRDFIPQAEGKAAGSDSTTFTTGSKDTLDISEWECTASNNVGDKTDIVNIYATAYYNASNEVILYFALERSGNEGDGNVGFWFTQSGDVACEAVGKKASRFDGVHVNGDLLIVSEFSNGGTVSTIVAYKWMNGSLIPVVSGGQCDGSGVGSTACAIVNSEPLMGYGIGTDIPWLVETKQPGRTASNNLDVSKFFEGGVNLSANNLEACFSTFLGVTRSSTSLTATLFDYAVGKFPFCSISTRKACDTVKLVDDDPLTYQVDFEAWVTNNGLAPISASETVTIVDNAGTDALSDDVTVEKSVSDLTGGGDWLPGVELYVTAQGSSDPTLPTGSFESLVNGPHNIVTATVTLAGSDEDLTATGENDCEPIDLTPMLSVEKTCLSSELVDYSGVLAVQNAYSINVCNTGSSPLKNIQIDDDTAGYSASLPKLDFAKLCQSDSDCIGTCSERMFKQCTGDSTYEGNYCSSNDQCGTGTCEVNDDLTVKQCTDDVDLVAGEFGDPVCFSTPTGDDALTYYPTSMSGENGTSQNQAVVTAEVPMDDGSTASIAESDSDTCDLCPTPYTAP